MVEMEIETRSSPNSLAATLAALPSMSPVPPAPFFVTANHALTAIPSPHFDLHRRRNQSVVRKIDDPPERFLLDWLQRKLEHPPFFIGKE